MSETTSEAQDRKFDAEAVLAKIQAKRAEFDLEAARLQSDADLRKAEADIRRLTADARLRETDAAAADITLLSVQEADERNRAQDEYHNIYRFTGPVSDDSVAKCMRILTMWARTRPGADIEIIFYSPGGSVTAGLALWDFIQEIKTGGHKVTTVVNGMAASMAGILLQAGDVRVMGKESWLMLHEISFGAQGKVQEVEDTTEWVKKVGERVLRIFAERSKLSIPKLRAMWNRKDAWISSDEALKHGLIDEVR